MARGSSAKRECRPGAGVVTIAPVMETPESLDRLLRERIAHADYAGARGRPVRVQPLGAPGAPAVGELRAVGDRQGPVAGYESFWLAFAIHDDAPVQALYRVEIEGLPAHALLLVPSARRDGVTEYHASFNRDAG